MVVRDNTELLGNGESLVIHHEGGIVAVLAGMPEPLVPDRHSATDVYPSPLPYGVGEVDVADLDDADIGNLDQGDRKSRRVDDYLPVAGARQRLGISETQEWRETGISALPHQSSMTAACEMRHSVSTWRADPRSYHGDDSVDIDAGHDAVQATRALSNPLVQVAIQPSA